MEKILKQAYEKAKKARNHAYTPYSGFKVGAALVTADGVGERIYSGCNVENASYGATICAERTALLTAVTAEGVPKSQLQTGSHNFFSFLIVVADTESPTPPCAQCLQVLSEFCDAGFPIYLANTMKILQKVTFEELLPFPFNGTPLQK
ncbi:MAG: cytidine deaminase [Spirochaetales bacterium]|nr:cytidine deaminase [Spirochaetales bacterium]